MNAVKVSSVIFVKSTLKIKNFNIIFFYYKFGHKSMQKMIKNK